MLIELIKKLFFVKTTDVKIQFFRYIFVGGMAFVADFIALFILRECVKLNLYLAVGIAFILGLLTNYVLSKLLVFTRENSVGEFITFTVIGIIGLIFTELLMHLFAVVLGVQYLISKAIVAGIVLVWNFTAQKIILYRNN